MKTIIPPGYKPDRFLVWCRWLRLHRKTYVSARSTQPKPLITT